MGVSSALYLLSKLCQQKVSPDIANCPLGAKLPWLRTTALKVIMSQGKCVNKFRNRYHWMLDSG